MYNEFNNVDNILPTYEPRTLINSTYEQIVAAISHCADAHIPLVRKQFYKFWWSQELSEYKSKSVQTDRLWKSAGRPRSGQLYSERCAAKRLYRQALRQGQRHETGYYSNDLHEALLNKQGTQFWKCWNSKMKNSPQIHLQVDGKVDSEYIANCFANHFIKSCANLTDEGSKKLRESYREARGSYVGSPFCTDYVFDAELVENIIFKMKRGKAAGLDNITAEHLQNCHPVLPALLSKLFNLCIQYGIVPDSFCMSYTIPLPKSSTVVNRSLSVDDFRGSVLARLYLKYLSIAYWTNLKISLLPLIINLGSKNLPVVLMLLKRLEILLIIT